MCCVLCVVQGGITQPSTPEKKAAKANHTDPRTQSLSLNAVVKSLKTHQVGDRTVQAGEVMDKRAITASSSPGHYGTFRFSYTNKNLGFPYSNTKPRFKDYKTFSKKSVCGTYELTLE